MDEFESFAWFDDSLMDSVFNHLGISKDATPPNISDMLSKTEYESKLHGLDPNTGQAYPGQLKMNRKWGQPYSEDDISTMAMVELFNKNSGMSGNEFAVFLSSDDGKKQLDELKAKYMDQYPLFKDSEGNQISPDKINLNQKRDLANYFMTDIGNRMHQMTHGIYYPDSSTKSVKKTGAVSDEFNALYNVILPKLMLIRKMQHYKTQEQIMKQYSMNNQQLAQYLVKLMDDTEKDIQEYLKKGNLISPLIGPNNFMKLNMNG